MDPQKLSQLDPKLREAYQRVMGTTIPEPQFPPVQTQTPPPADGSTIPTPDPIPTPQQPQPIPTIPTDRSNPSIPQPEPAPSSPEPVAEPQPIQMPDPATQAQPTSNFTQMNSEVSAAPSLNSPNFSAPALQVATFKKKNGIMPILFGFVGLIFIAIYTLFWTKIFNFKLPFLP